MSDGIQGVEAAHGGAFRCRLLVVDDDTNARTALAEILREEGYDVALAADGLEALEMLGEFRPEVVVADVRMPRLDGIALIARVRASLDEPPLFVLMSAYPPPRGTVDVPYFVGKPIDLDVLLRAVGDATAASRARH